MECDSMHAAIEHEKKYVDVFTMLDWISIFGRTTRRHRYKVKNLITNISTILTKLSQLADCIPR